MHKTIDCSAMESISVAKYPKHQLNYIYIYFLKNKESKIPTYLNLNMG